MVGGAALLVLILLWVGFRSWLFRARLDWSIQRGLQLLEGVHRAENVGPIVLEWEQQTGPYWRDHADDMSTRLFNRHDLSDARVRWLLQAVSGAYYGDRLDDWRRWRRDRERLAEGRAPEVSRGARVELEALPTAPVGLTAWFTTILVLDGQIFVPSLGGIIADADDPGDGVVRIDGVSLESELIFSPPDRTPRDVIGIAAADDGLFVACRNGFVYHTTYDGELRWREFCVSAIVSVPLAVDLNGDNVRDVVVVTESGSVVAVNGQTNTTPWVASLGRRPSLDEPGPLVQATIAAGDVLGGDDLELVIVTEAGDITVLSARTGAVRWRYGVTPNQYSGPLTLSGAPEGASAFFLGDARANVWRFTRQSRDLNAVTLSTLGLRSLAAITADVRTLDAGPDAPVELVACVTGSPALIDGAVCVIGAQGLRWRYPPGGMIWTAPAVADVNGDRASELIVASTQHGEDGVAGLLTVVSRDGHALARQQLPNPVEAPVVVADVNGDGRLEILVTDTSGVLRTFATRGVGGQVEWGLAAGDTGNTREALQAYSWGQVMSGFQKRWRPDP